MTSPLENGMREFVQQVVSEAFANQRLEEQASHAALIEDRLAQVRSEVLEEFQSLYRRSVKELSLQVQSQTNCVENLRREIENDKLSIEEIALELHTRSGSADIAVQELRAEFGVICNEWNAICGKPCSTETLDLTQSLGELPKGSEQEAFQAALFQTANDVRHLANKVRTNSSVASVENVSPDLCSSVRTIDIDQFNAEITFGLKPDLGAPKARNSGGSISGNCWQSQSQRERANVTNGSHVQRAMNGSDWATGLDASTSSIPGKIDRIGRTALTNSIDASTSSIPGKIDRSSSPYSQRAQLVFRRMAGGNFAAEGERDNIPTVAGLSTARNLPAEHTEACPRSQTPQHRKPPLAMLSQNVPQAPVDMYAAGLNGLPNAARRSLSQGALTPRGTLQAAQGLHCQGCSRPMSRSPGRSRPPGAAFVPAHPVYEVLVTRPVVARWP